MCLSYCLIHQQASVNSVVQHVRSSGFDSDRKGSSQGSDCISLLSCSDRETTPPPFAGKLLVSNVNLAFFFFNFDTAEVIRKFTRDNFVEVNEDVEFDFDHQPENDADDEEEEEENKMMECGFFAKLLGYDYHKEEEDDWRSVSSGEDTLQCEVEAQSVERIIASDVYLGSDSLAHDIEKKQCNSKGISTSFGNVNELSLKVTVKLSDSDKEEKNLSGSVGNEQMMDPIVHPLSAKVPIPPVGNRSETSSQNSSPSTTVTESPSITEGKNGFSNTLKPLPPIGQYSEGSERNSEDSSILSGHFLSPGLSSWPHKFNPAGLSCKTDNEVNAPASLPARPPKLDNIPAGLSGPNKSNPPAGLLARSHKLDNEDDVRASLTFLNVNLPVAPSRYPHNSPATLSRHISNETVILSGPPRNPLASLPQHLSTEVNVSAAPSRHPHNSAATNTLSRRLNTEVNVSVTLSDHSCTEVNVPLAHSGHAHKFDDKSSIVPLYHPLKFDEIVNAPAVPSVQLHKSDDKVNTSAAISGFSHKFDNFPITQSGHHSKFDTRASGSSHSSKSDNTVNLPALFPGLTDNRLIDDKVTALGSHSNRKFNITIPAAHPDRESI